MEFIDNLQTEISTKIVIENMSYKIIMPKTKTKADLPPNFRLIVCEYYTLKEF